MAVDKGEIGRLGIKGLGEYGEIFGVRVKVIGYPFTATRASARPYVFCNHETARVLMKYTMPGQTTYIIAKCKPGTDLEAVVNRLNGYPSA